MGCAAGCILYLIRGMWLSPKSERLYGGIMLLKKRAPILGGSLYAICRKFRFVGRTIFDIKLCTNISAQQIRYDKPNYSRRSHRRFACLQSRPKNSIQKRSIWSLVFGSDWSRWDGNDKISKETAAGNAELNVWERYQNEEKVVRQNAARSFHSHRISNRQQSRKQGYPRLNHFHLYFYCLFSLIVYFALSS